MPFFVTPASISFGTSRAEIKSWGLLVGLNTNSTHGGDMVPAGSCNAAKMTPPRNNRPKHMNERVTISGLHNQWGISIYLGPFLVYPTNLAILVHFQPFLATLAFFVILAIFSQLEGKLWLFVTVCTIPSHFLKCRPIAAISGGNQPFLPFFSATSL